MAKPLQDPWFRPDVDLAAQLLEEARREIRPGHELHGVELVECLARCSGCDETVFKCSDESFAFIHLSWQAREHPPWPMSERVGSYLALELVMDQHEL